MATNVLRGRQARLFLDSSSGSTGVAFGAVTAWTLRRETRVTQLDSTGNARVRMPAAPVSWSLQINALTLSSGVGGQETLRGLLNSGGRYYVRLYNESTGSTAYTVPRALDTFTEASTIPLQNHTPDIPGGVVVYGRTGYTSLNIAESEDVVTMSLAKNTSGVALTDGDATGADGDGEWFVDLDSIQFVTGTTGTMIQLVCRSDGAVGSLNGIAVGLIRNGVAQQVNLIVREYVAGAVVESTTAITGLTMVNTDYRIGVTIVGTSAIGWVEPIGGGTRTTGTAHTLADVRTGQTRFGLSAVNDHIITPTTVKADNLTFNAPAPRQAWRGYAHVDRWTQAGTWMDVQRHNVTLQGDGALSLST